MIQFNLVSVTDSASSFSLYFVKQTHLQYKRKQPFRFHSRKEVFQPHLPVRLPCYDFTPLTLHTFGASPLSVGPATSGADDSGGVTGGVYKARERIHRGMLIHDY